MNLTRLLLLFEPDGRSPSGQQQNRPRYDACERAVQSICVQFELQLLLLSQRERLNRAIEEHRKVLNAEAIDGPCATCRETQNINRRDRGISRR